ncbi:hypothetical protein HMPREF9620_02466 [Cutibacterium acnes HL037PA1]|nr:hypothetical protein HMPREF9620_02466 [Cutibacterium acnes HL037PA1]
MGDYSDVCRGTNDDSRQPWTRTISFFGGARDGTHRIGNASQIMLFRSLSILN